ncbi:unnamed protein product [Rhodiola kirilowii]
MSVNTLRKEPTASARTSSSDHRPPMLQLGGGTWLGMNSSC